MGEYWKDMKITYEEFVDMLRRNDNVEIEGEEAVPKKFKVKESELKEEFSTLSKGDGSIDFEDIEKVETRFGLPPGISGDMEYWKDMKITYEEFVDMLRRNDNVEIEEEEAVPKKFKVKESELKEEFSTLSKGDGSIDFEDVEKVETRFGLPSGISSDMEYGKNRKFIYEESVDMLRKNDNVKIEEESAPKKL